MWYTKIPCDTLQCPVIHYNAMWHTTMPCDTLQCHVTHYNAMWHTTMPCDTLQCHVTHYNAMCRWERNVKGPLIVMREQSDAILQGFLCVLLLPPLIGNAFTYVSITTATEWYHLQAYGYYYSHWVVPPTGIWVLLQSLSGTTYRHICALLQSLSGTTYRHASIITVTDWSHLQAHEQYNSDWLVPPTDMWALIQSLSGSTYRYVSIQWWWWPLCSIQHIVNIQYAGWHPGSESSTSTVAAGNKKEKGDDHVAELNLHFNKGSCSVHGCPIPTQKCSSK